MGIGRRNFDALNGHDLDSLVAAEVGEGHRLEFKSQPFAQDHDGNTKFLKAITSFANTAGGDLLIGVREMDGVASAIQPITSVSADTHQQRLESLLQTTIEPRIFGIRIRPIPYEAGYVLAIRVPRSAFPPHRVTASKSNRFYLRSSSGAYEASMDELRALFGETAEARNAFEQWRDDQRKQLVLNTGHILLAPIGNKLTLHIAPLGFRSRPQNVNLSAAQQNELNLRPLGTGHGFNSEFNVLGFATVRGGELCHGYTQLYRDGRIEATKVNIVTDYEGVRIFHAPSNMANVQTAIRQLLQALEALDVSPPFLVSVTVQGLTGTSVVASLGHHFFEPPPPIRTYELVLPTCIIQDYGTADDYTGALRPALDALWNAGGKAQWEAPVKPGG